MLPAKANAGCKLLLGDALAQHRDTDVFTDLLGHAPHVDTLRRYGLDCQQNDSKMYQTDGTQIDLKHPSSDARDGGAG